MREPPLVKTLWTSSTGWMPNGDDRSHSPPSLRKRSMILKCTSFLTMWTTTGGCTGISAGNHLVLVLVHFDPRPPARRNPLRYGAIGWWITLSALGSASGSLKPTGSMSPIGGSGVQSRLPNSWSLGNDQWFARTRPRLPYETVTEWILYIINTQSTLIPVLNWSIGPLGAQLVRQIISMHVQDNLMLLKRWRKRGMQWWTLGHSISW